MKRHENLPSAPPQSTPQELLKPNPLSKTPILLLLGLVTSWQVAQAQMQSFHWAKQAGGSGANLAPSVAVDSSGAVYVAGSFAETSTFGITTLTPSGSHDAYVAKLDASGNFLWATKAGGNNDDRANSVAVDSAGNVYVAGYFSGTATFGATTLASSGMFNQPDAYVAKLDAGGNFLWVRRPDSGSPDYACSVAVDSAGNVYVAGYFVGTATFGTATLTTTSGSPNAFVAKLDTNGNFLWAKQAGGSLEARAGSVAVDNSGNVYVAGSFQGTAAFGATTLTASGYFDAYVAKLDTSGNFVWTRQAGGSDDDRADSVAVDSAGNVYWVGYFQSTANFGATALTSSGTWSTYVAKLDAVGNFLWVKPTSGTILDGRTGAVAVDSAGSIYVAGAFIGSATFGATTLTTSGTYDAYVAKLDAGGSFVGVRQAGGSNVDYAYSVAVANTGNAYLAGMFERTATFGGTTLTSSSRYNGFVAKMGTGQPPSVITQPTGQAFTLGASLNLTVNADGTLPLSYQWQFNGANIAGANSSILVVSNLAATNAGAYRVVITNSLGTTTSPAADVYFFGDLKFIAATVLAGSIGQQYRVDYADVVTVGTTNWLTLTNVTLPYSPFLVIDPNSAGRTQRYYRAVPLP